MPALDPRAITAERGVERQVHGYRAQAKGFDPRSGEGARRFGGRFNPRRSFPAIYLCETQACVSAEIRRQATRQGVSVAALLPREIWSLEVHLDRVLDLTDPATLTKISVGPADLTRDDWTLTQEIGELAFEHRFQAIRSQSATGVDTVIALFPEHLRGSAITAALDTTWVSVADVA